MFRGQTPAVRELKRQPHDCGILYSYQRRCKGRGRLFVFEQEKRTVEELFGGLGGALKFGQRNNPGKFETGRTNLGTRENPKFVFVKGHPYQSLVTLHEIEQAMEPETDNYIILPLRKFFGTADISVMEYLNCFDLKRIEALVLKDKWRALPSISDYQRRLADLDKALELIESERYQELWGKMPKNVHFCDSFLYEERWGRSTGGRGMRAYEIELYDLTEISVCHQKYEDKTTEQRKTLFKKEVDAKREFLIWDIDSMLRSLEKHADGEPGEIVEIIKRKFETAVAQLLKNLERIGKKLRVSRHVDPRYENVFFRGVQGSRLMFTLLDQYHCGDEERIHHEHKYGFGPLSLCR